MAFEIYIVGSTNEIIDKKNLLAFSRAAARVCYSRFDFNQVTEESLTKISEMGMEEELIKRLLKSGHHSPFEHIHLNLYLDGIPKALAMVLNNEKAYVTSEKSARYTKMEGMPEDQKEKYDRWTEILVPEIEKYYPKLNDKKAREQAILKLSRENARYMISVFTPTRMLYTLNLRQLNFLRYEFMRFIEENFQEGTDNFRSRLSESMQEFLRQTENFEIEGLRNITKRKLSFFGNDVEEYFGDTYSTNYLISFAGLAQAQRHRTINYHISGGIDERDERAPYGFYVPTVIPKNMLEEWISDLEDVSKKDYPQGQLLMVNERGIPEDFVSKMSLRLCGHAQYEIMKNTLHTSLRFSKYNELVLQELDNSRCSQAFDGKDACVFCPRRRALKERVF